MTFSTKSTFHNALAIEFSTEGQWKRPPVGRYLSRRSASKGNFLSRWEHKLQGFPKVRKLTKGALYDQNGHIIHESIRKGGIYGDQVVSIAPIIVDPNTACRETIEGNSAYLGNLYSHYGHFITEGLSRLHDYRALNDFDNLLFYPFVFDYPYTRLTSYHRYFLDQLGIDQSKVRILNQTTKLERVTVFRQLWTLNDSVDPHLTPLYAHLRSIEPKLTTDDSKIYCSRRSSSRVSHPDRISNQPALEEFFRSKDFVIVFPEDLSMEEQMGLYRGRNLVISLSGSALHNILFGRGHTRFVELGDQRTPKAPHIMQLLANSLAVSDYQFIPLATKDGRNWDLSVLEAAIDSL